MILFFIEANEEKMKERTLFLERNFACLFFLVISHAEYLSIYNKKNMIYHLIRSLWKLMSLLPMWILYFISDLVYFPLYYVVRYRRKVVRKNLVKSFPEKAEKEIVKIEKGFYSWFCDYVVETIKIRSMNEKEMRERMTFDGLEEIYAQMEAKGQTLCFAYLGHYCNWEWVASLPLWTGDKLHCAQIYHPLENETMNKLFLEQRSRFGAENIAMNDTLRRMITLKKEGQKTIIGFIADQTPHWNSIHLWMDFFNQETPVFTGTERIAKQLDACLCYIDIQRTRRGYYKAHFKLMDLTGKTTSEYPITETYMRLLEETIKQAPSYWLWSHNRWKRSREKFESRFQIINGKVILKKTGNE